MLHGLLVKHLDHTSKQVEMGLSFFHKTDTGSYYEWNHSFWLGLNEP